MAMSVDGRGAPGRSIVRAAMDPINGIDADTCKACRACVAHELRRAPGTRRGAAPGGAGRRADLQFVRLVH